MQLEIMLNFYPSQLRFYHSFSQFIYLIVYELQVLVNMDFSCLLVCRFFNSFFI